MDHVYQALKTYYGYDEFRPLQKEIISDVLAFKDTFVLMPTGGGKSLCYQLPSLLIKGTAIVVSPLISLMKDQVDSLKQNGISAAYLNSTQTMEQQSEIVEKLRNGTIKLLYIAPERLVLSQFIALLKELSVSFFAIDEAHCISQWGHDFRPEYRKLSLLKKEFPSVPIIALTATATPRVKQDIISQLCLSSSSEVYQASFNRHNLYYAVVPKDDAFKQTHEFIAPRQGKSGIVYCLSRKTAEQVSEKLQGLGISALPYHAGLSDYERHHNQDVFLKDEVTVIVATIAFGMGINKSNVRYVIHYDLPKSLEHYYQETGRAGRDGLPSECLLLYRESDKIILQRFISQIENEEEQKSAHAQLAAISQFANSTICRRTQLLSYFGEDYTLTSCGLCDNCLSPREKIEGTIIAQKILSCVLRVHERFGSGYIADILRGGNIKRIKENNHDQLSTYGLLSEYTSEQIEQFIQELSSVRLLTQTPDQYAVLSLTEKGKLFLKQKQTITLNKPRITNLGKVSRSIEESQKGDSELFEILRALRKQIATEANVPPYIIFSDLSLQQMASYYPQTKEQFKTIYGVGEEKLEKYAERFLKEIISYCTPKHISPVMASLKRPNQFLSKKNVPKKRSFWSNY